MAPPGVWPSQVTLWGSVHLLLPVFCGLVSHAESGFEGFLFVQGAAEPPILPSYCHLVSLMVVLDGGGEGVGAVTQV